MSDPPILIGAWQELSPFPEVVSTNAFDVVGARACGYRGAYVNRYDLPCEDLPAYQPDVIVHDFTELAEVLLQ